MKNGDEITFITVRDKCEPGDKMKVVVKDEKDGVLTVTCHFVPKTICIIAEHDHTIYTVKRFVGAFKHEDGRDMPAIIQLRRDPVAEKMFKEEALKPFLNRKAMRYEYGMSERTLNAWTDLGVLSKKKADWYYGCPECDALTAVRRGCRNCRSSRLRSKMLVRHKPCGFMDYARRFDSFVCPKCRCDLVDGTYEDLQSPPVCLDCQFLNDNHPHYVATCLECKGCFELTDTNEVPIYEYSHRQPQQTQPEETPDDYAGAVG